MAGGTVSVSLLYIVMMNNNITYCMHGIQEFSGTLSSESGSDDLGAEGNPVAGNTGQTNVEVNNEGEEGEEENEREGVRDMGDEGDEDEEEGGDEDEGEDDDEDFGSDNDF